MVRKLLNSLINDDYLLNENGKQLKTNLTLSVLFTLLTSLVVLVIYLLRGALSDIVYAGSTALICLFSLLLVYRLNRHEWALYVFSVGLMLAAYYVLLFGSSEFFSALWILAYPVLFCLFIGNTFARPYLTLLLASMLLIFSPLFDAWRTSGYSADFRMQLPALFVIFAMLSMFARYLQHRTSRLLLTMYRRCYESASRDPLTGLLNRRAFYDTIPREQSRVRRHSGGLQLIMCDIDHFKIINDRYGHQGGDLFLVHIADMLKEQLRGDDYCFRWGGEEFLLLLPNTTPAGALLAARRMRDTIERTPLVDERVGEITGSMSFGVHAFDLTSSVDDNIARADECLYKAKKNGRNRVETG